jgi:hypothetical protein
MAQWDAAAVQRDASATSWQWEGQSQGYFTSTQIAI